MNNDNVHPIFKSIPDAMSKPLTSYLGELVFKFEKEMKEANKKFMGFPGYIYILPDHNIVVAFNHPLDKKQFITVKGWTESGYRLEILDNKEKLLKFLLSL